MSSGQEWGWRFIDLAALGTNSVRSYVLTLLAVVLLPVIFIVVAFVAIFGAAAIGWLPASAVHGMVIVAAFASLAVAGIALAWSVVHLHRRPWMSLISPDLKLDWRRLAIGAAVEAGLLLVVVAVGHLATGEPWRFGTKMGLPAMALLFLLIPLQAASEEMLFRGYLTQAVGRLVRRRSLIVLAVGVLFGALHFNAYGPLTVPYLAGVSLIFSLISLRDERLELTIGAHTAMNWLGVATGVLSADRADIRLNWGALGVLLVHGALFYGLSRLLVRLFCRPQTLKA